MPVPTKLNCTLFYFTENSLSINAVLVLTFVDSAYRTDIWNTIACNLYGLYGETKLICWSMGLTDPILSKNKKIILQNFGQLAFF